MNKQDGPIETTSAFTQLNFAFKLFKLLPVVPYAASVSDVLPSIR